MIPYGRQSVDDDDVAAVVEVLRGDWLTQGPHVVEFEDRLREVTGARHAIALSSGTAALHAAAAAARLGPGDVVATPALTFAASANCARYVGADVRFVDLDESTWNLDTAAVPEEATALVAVHYAGLPVDLSTLSRRPRVVIEDAAHAIGASTPDGPVGSCARSDLCCFSFHPVKTITTGEGGAVTTNSDELAERIRAFRHHGIRPDPDAGPWAYDIAELGANYRLTDVAAALGTSQLAKLGRFVDRRNEIAARYREVLGDVPDVRLPPAAPEGFRHAHHLFPVHVPGRQRVYELMRAAGIGVQVHYVPVHHLSAYGDAAAAADLPVTESLYAGLLSLPMFPALEESEQDLVVDVLRTALEAS